MKRGHIHHKPPGFKARSHSEIGYSTPPHDLWSHEELCLFASDKSNKLMI